MPFKTILKNLVESTPGATGAILADWEGEAVEQHSLNDVYELKVTAAHKGIIISQLKDVIANFPVVGELEHVVIRTDSQHFIAGVVGADYSLVMTLDSGAIVGRAVTNFADTVRALRKEIY